MRIYKKTFHVSSFDNLIVSLFVVGYKNIGESIIVLFRDKTDNDEKIIMSMVIDNYEKGDLNLTCKILKKYGVDKLDFACWTHPHCDHSIGMDKLIANMFHDNIVIFTPEFHFPMSKFNLIKSESQKIESIYNNIHKIIKNHKNKQEIWRTILANGDMTSIYPMCLIADDCNDEKEIYYYFLTPLSIRTDEYAINENTFNNPNELSVSFVMSLDDYDFYFGGDTENEHVTGIDMEIIKNMRWIKVPHHCSKGAIHVANNLGPQFDYAASTVYTSSGLPNKDIQNIYAKAGSLHMTQLEEYGDYHLDYEYGIVQYDYHFKKKEAIVDITTYGNAGQYYVASNRDNDDEAVGDEMYF